MSTEPVLGSAVYAKRWQRDARDWPAIEAWARTIAEEA